MSKQWFETLTAPSLPVTMTTNGTAPEAPVFLDEGSTACYYGGLRVTDELGLYKIHFVFPDSMDTTTPLTGEEIRKLEAAETVLGVMTPIVKEIAIKCLESCRAAEWQNLNGETLFIARVVVTSCEPYMQAMLHSIRKFNADHGIKG